MSAGLAPRSQTNGVRRCTGIPEFNGLGLKTNRGIVVGAKPR